MGMICRNCQQENPETNTFCLACGAALGAEDTNIQEIKRPPNSPLIKQEQLSFAIGKLVLVVAITIIAFISIHYVWHK